MQDGDNALVAVASDGAGSARFADIGAKITCYLLADGISEFLKSGGMVKELTRDEVKKLIVKLNEELLIHASIHNSIPRDFASTLIAAVIGMHEAVFFQIGDGAAVISEQKKPGEYRPVFWPQNKLYANMTHFVTDCGLACETMEYTMVEGAVNEIAVFSDGLQNLALHYQSRTAYTPFFRPLFNCLRLLNCTGSCSILNSLSCFLNSDKVNKRTDDDKTLIIAVREG